MHRFYTYIHESHQGGLKTFLNAPGMKLDDLKQKLGGL